MTTELMREQWAAFAWVPSAAWARSMGVKCDASSAVWADDGLRAREWAAWPVEGLLYAVVSEGREFDLVLGSDPAFAGYWQAHRSKAALHRYPYRVAVTVRDSDGRLHELDDREVEALEMAETLLSAARRGVADDVADDFTAREIDLMSAVMSAVAAE